MGGAGPHHRLTAAAIAAVLALMVAACGSNDENQPLAADRTSAVRLAPTKPLSEDSLAHSAEVVERRLHAARFRDAVVEVDGDALAVHSTREIGAAVLQSVAQVGELTFHDIENQLPPGDCSQFPDAIPGHAKFDGCFLLGPVLLDGDGVESAHAIYDQATASWVIEVRFGDDRFLDKIAEPLVNHRIAIAVDDVVFSAPTINPGITGRAVQINGNFSEDEARALAVNLDAGGTLPVKFEVHAPLAPGVTTTTTTAVPTSEHPVANGDHWHAALGVNICGTWLPNAPAFEFRGGPTEPSGKHAGLHSHGDGLVHVHPFARDEAGANATLGRFLEDGGWRADATSLRLWDDATHTNGGTCDGTPARVRWSVDGDERPGDPSTLRVGDGQVIALAFLPAGGPIGVPPQADALATPTGR